MGRQSEVGELCGRRKADFLWPAAPHPTQSQSLGRRSLWGDGPVGGAVLDSRPGGGQLRAAALEEAGRPGVDVRGQPHAAAVTPEADREELRTQRSVRGWPGISTGLDWGQGLG